MCALARANSATAPPRKSLIEKTWTADQLLHCRKSISVIAVLSTMALGYLIHQVLPSVHPPEDRRTSVGRTKTDFSKHTKTFPRKKLAVTTGKKLVDLRDAAFKLFEVVQKPSGGCLPSPSNCYQPNAWVLVVQLGCETQNNFKSSS